MAAPATSVRGTPTGAFLKNGYQILIAFAANLTVAFWEKTVQPPSVDGGDEIETTTQHNILVRTFSMRSLYTIGNTVSVVAYDPAVLDEIYSLVNVEGAITINHPNSDTWDFFGALKMFEPQTNENGTQPEANVVIVATNTDPANNDVEATMNQTTALGTD